METLSNSLPWGHRADLTNLRVACAPPPPGKTAISADGFKKLINLSQIFQNAFGRNP